MKGFFGYLFNEARKALVAGLGTGIGVAITGVQQDLGNHGTITQADAEQIVGAAIVLGVLAGAATWRTANRPAAAQAATPIAPAAKTP